MSLMEFFSMYKTVPGKAGFASQLGKLCLEKVASFIMEEATSFLIRDQKGFRFWNQCTDNAEMGQLVLSRFLSLLMSGDRKYKFNVASSVFSWWDIKEAIEKSTKKGQARVMQGEWKRYVFYWVKQVSLPFGEEMCCKVSVCTVWKYPHCCRTQRSF